MSCDHDTCTYPGHSFVSGNKMASYLWFSIKKPAYLPDPDVERTEDKAAEVREAVLVQLRKRPSSYNYPELWSKIRKFAATSGNKAAVGGGGGGGGWGVMEDVKAVISRKCFKRAGQTSTVRGMPH